MWHGRVSIKEEEKEEACHTCTFDSDNTKFLVLGTLLQDHKSHFGIGSVFDKNTIFSYRISTISNITLNLSPLFSSFSRRRQISALKDYLQTLFSLQLHQGFRKTFRCWPEYHNRGWFPFLHLEFLAEVRNFRSLWPTIIKLCLRKDKPSQYDSPSRMEFIHV